MGGVEAGVAAGRVRDAVEHAVAGRAAAAADGVVPDEAVRDDGEERPREIGVQDMAGRQADGAGRFHRVGCVVALDPVVRIVAEEVHRLAALEVDRKSVVSGKSVSVRVDLGGRRTIKKKIMKKHYKQTSKQRIRSNQMSK